MSKGNIHRRRVKKAIMHACQPTWIGLYHQKKPGILNMDIYSTNRKNIETVRCETKDNKSFKPNIHWIRMLEYDYNSYSILSLKLHLYHKTRKY